MEKVILITGSENTKDFLLLQLKEIITDKYILEAYSEEKGISSKINKYIKVHTRTAKYEWKRRKGKDF